MACGPPSRRATSRERLDPEHRHAMTEFRSRRKGAVYVELPPYAAGLLANLTRQLIELLSDGESTSASDDPLEAMVGLDGPRDTPEDPALLRLLPDAHPEDPEASAEFRRLTE